MMSYLIKLIAHTSIFEYLFIRKMRYAGKNPTTVKFWVILHENNKKVYIEYQCLPNVEKSMKWGFDPPSPTGQRFPFILDIEL